MRTLPFLAALLLSPAANAQTLDDLSWLKGCWRTLDRLTAVISGAGGADAITFSYRRIRRLARLRP